MTTTTRGDFTTGYLTDAAIIPLVVEPVEPGVRLVDWARDNGLLVGRLLLEHRALLFRNFDVDVAAEVEQVVAATSSGELLEYRDRSSPRHEVGNRIYTSTDYPAEQSIFLHNEGTYWMRWPLKVYFACAVAAATGGETPIADCRKVLARLSPRVRERFTQVMYVRNFNDGFGLTWQTVFQTEERREVESYCRANAIEYEWKDGERLRTRAVRPTVAVHPLTGESTWFNHAAFFHVTTLPPLVRDGLLDEFEEDELPFNTYYGDGSPIEPDVLDEIRDAYAREKVAFRWRVGDVLLLDNMSVAHGREPFTGQRKVIVGMAEPTGRDGA